MRSGESRLLFLRELERRRLHSRRKVNKERDKSKGGGGGGATTGTVQGGEPGKTKMSSENKPT